MKKGLKSCLLIIIGLIALLGVGVAAMFAAKICPPSGPWPQPPWCEGGVSGPPLAMMPGVGELVQDDFDYYAPGEIKEYLDNNQVLMISPHFGRPQDMIQSDGASWASLQVESWSDNAVKVLHGEGLHLLGAAMTVRHLNISEADPKPDLAALDLSGNPIPLTKPGMSEYLPGEFYYSIFNPGWQDLLLEQGRHLIDYGAEGIVLDEPSTYADLIYEGGGSFDSYSLDGFRDHLADKYTADELLSLFGIEDIAAFDFGNYIRENQLEDSWNASRQNPPLITFEFYLFQSQGTEDFIRRFAEEMKVYAREEYGRDFVISFNNSPLYEFSHFIAVDFLDYLTGELFYFTSGHTRAGVVRKMADGVYDGQVALLVEVGHDTGELPAQSTNLVKYLFADIFSSTGTGMIIPSTEIYTMRNGGYEEQFVTYDNQELERYYTFMHQNRHLFNLQEPAQVGVVHSSPSFLSYMLPSEDQLWGSPDIRSLLDLLLYQNIPFGMLVSGDGTWAMNELTLAQLEEYPLVMLPGIDLISDAEIDALLRYVEAGGIVVQINGFGSYDKDAARVDRPGISSLVQTGSHTYGQGIWHTLALFEELTAYSWSDAEGREIQPTEHAADDPAVAAILETLALYQEPQISSAGPDTVTIRRYQDGDRWVLHLVNYAYDQTSDSFTPSGPFQVTVDVGGTAVSQAKTYDFESGVIGQLEFSQSGNLVTLEVPGLEVYTIIELLP